MIEYVMNAVETALSGASRLPAELLAVEGMSSTRVRILLNEICRDEDCSYLEIGAWKGSTVLAASYGNPGYFRTIDNFSEFGGPKADLLANQERFKDVCNFSLIETSAWDFDPEPQSVNVFFYDGNHSEFDQYRAFAHFDTAFERQFVAIVDDWNQPEVRRATRAAFSDLCYQVVDEWSFESRRNGDRDTWWNGIYLALILRF